MAYKQTYRVSVIISLLSNPDPETRKKIHLDGITTEGLNIII